jgi:hypothetical protein
MNKRPFDGPRPYGYAQPYRRPRYSLAAQLPPGGGGVPPPSPPPSPPPPSPPPPAPLVFLSHAGEQKRDFVDCLYMILTEVYGVGPVFMDEHSLVPSTLNEPVMLAAVKDAPLGALRGPGTVQGG